MKKIKKAIIPVAGLGTRFLPWSKNIPKEMLPILNKPTIQYIVEEAVASGIEEILLITSNAKESLVDHFDRNLFLEETLIKKGKEKVAIEIKQISRLARIYTIRQFEPRGLGHAVLQAKFFVGDEPFALLLGDDVTFNLETPTLKQLIRVYEKYNSSVLGVQKVPLMDVNKYGIVFPKEEVEKNTFLVDDLKEKPKEENPTSDLAICGRYILTPKIFDFLQEENVDVATNEIQITDSIKKLSKIENVYAYTFAAKRYDMGSVVGFINANVDFAIMKSKGEEKERLIDSLEKHLKELKK